MQQPTKYPEHRVRLTKASKDFKQAIYEVFKPIATPILDFLARMLARKDPWEYGTCHERPARRHRKHKNVQFILWPAGEQGHKEDYWHNFDSSWWQEFKPEA